jgi:replicative DNA helicase
MVQQLDTLKKFGLSFQHKCVATLLHDKKYLEQIHDIIHVDYFDSDALKWIVKKIEDYYVKYKEIITLEVFKIQLDEVEVESQKASIIENLKNIYNKLSDTDIEYIREQFLEFCKNQKLKSAIMDSVDMLKSGQYSEIKRLVDNAMKAGAERNLGHDYIKDLDKRMSEVERNTIKTGWELLDDLMHGGLGAGELAFIISASGSGKSWLLSRIGVNALKQGKNVIHYTLELNENYVGLRYDACFSGIDFQEVRNNVDTIKSCIKEEYGKLIVKYYPVKTVSCHTLSAHVEQVKNLYFKPDLLIVDYADLLRSVYSDKNSNSYSEMGSIYEELRSLAGELQVPIWTVSQSHRSSADNEIIEASGVADSYKKIMTADFVMSLSRKREDKLANTARFHIIKNRFGADGMTYPAYMNTSNGEVTLYDSNSSEGLELQNRMKSNTSNEKKYLLDKFKQMNQNSNSDNTNDDF